MISLSSGPRARPVTLPGPIPALLCAGVLFAACDSTVAPAADPPQRLIFISSAAATAGTTWQDREKDIFRINIDGTGLENLTGQPVRHYRSLSLSPDGGRIAYNRLSDCYGIWTMDPDGTDTRLVAGSDEFRCTYMPRWSPDGTRIAFTSTRGQVGFAIYVIDADGGSFRNVSYPLEETGQNFPAGWSPDGRIVFHYWGPDGIRTWITKPDGTERMQFFDLAGDHSPAWSPDGSRIVFLSERDGAARLSVMNADGTNVRKLSDLPGEDELDRRSIWENDHSPWSPDGGRIVFRNIDGATSRLYVVNADGTGLQPITEPWLDVRFNGWSPDGDRIAFTGMTAANSDVYIVRPDGSDLRNLTASGWHDGYALWLPRRR